MLVILCRSDDNRTLFYGRFSRSLATLVSGHFTDKLNKMPCLQTSLNVLNLESQPRRRPQGAFPFKSFKLSSVYITP